MWLEGAVSILCHSCSTPRLLAKYANSFATASEPLREAVEVEAVSASIALHFGELVGLDVQH